MAPAPATPCTWRRNKVSHPEARTAGAPSRGPRPFSLREMAGLRFRLRLRRRERSQQALHGPAADDVLIDDGGHICWGHAPVPDALRVNHHRNALLAVVQAPG